jgi:hypothetical protein
MPPQSLLGIEVFRRVVSTKELRALLSADVPGLFLTVRIDMDFGRIGYEMHYEVIVRQSRVILCKETSSFLKEAVQGGGGGFFKRC